MDVEIKIADLRLVVGRILDHIEYDLGHTVVKLDQDDYWDVADEERYDFAKSPTGLGHGQLRDDWEFLRSILDDKGQAVSLIRTLAA